MLKNAWKQLGTNKQAGTTVTNSCTFDLIALIKAARSEDKEAATHVAKRVSSDLKNFLKLEKN